ncbi:MULTISPECIES: transposase family protein [Streptosporangium]|uniref:DDE Tnp4 domain-containing protein n=1 Tax=Streptosporangium brasiliense TaxID=47480 RepID=A0ABT9R9V3_9ACTN|nr:transposase family protein [Streptosporangium brasiliense]MDP9866028.1 hypothetical protein [Streptosporangium brasiliense]
MRLLAGDCWRATAAGCAKYVRKFPGWFAITRRPPLLMVLGWFRGESDICRLGRDHRVSHVTAYRYIHEGIEVLAAQAPNLHEALDRAQAEQLAYVIMDGILIPTDRCAEQTLSLDNHTYNRLLRALRCLGKNGFALLKGRWRTLQHITVSPSQISDIARTALVLTHFEHGHLPGIH